MCTVCGCGPSDDHHHDHDHDHDHGHDHHHSHDHGHHHGPLGAAHASGMDAKRIVQIETDILSHNNGHAARIRATLADKGIFALNLVSSPGSGKTTLLCRTAEALKDRFPLAVIEGDQQTSNDADRIRATGTAAVQVNTGKGCHLDAHMVEHALEHLAPADDSVLFIENVGNLVCPAAFDLGEACKVVILSVTEGEDKPLKYPDMFAAAALMVLNKADLLPHLDFDVDACIANARRVNPDIAVLHLSARTGEGMAAWLEWIGTGRLQAVGAKIKRLEESLRAAKANLEK